MDNQRIDPNGMLKFTAILDWIAKRNRYSKPASESSHSHRNPSEYTFHLQNEPVTIAVTVQDNQEWYYYEKVLDGVATVCELDFNQDVDHILIPMVKNSQCMELVKYRTNNIDFEMKLTIKFRNGYGYEGGRNG